MYYYYAILWVFYSICCGTLANRNTYETKCT